MGERTAANMQVNRNLQILISDSRTLWRESLRLTIERHDPTIEILETGSIANIASQIADSGKIDLILLYFEPQILDGKTRIEELRRDLPEVPVVVVADAREPYHIVQVLRWGAAGYIPGNLDSRVMVAALRLVSLGSIYIPEQIIELVNDYAGKQATEENASRHLNGVIGAITPRQRQVLDALRLGKQNKLIAHQLGISENTVKAHLRQIMKRLNATNRTEAVLIASGLAGGGGNDVDENFAVPGHLSAARKIGAEHKSTQ